MKSARRPIRAILPTLLTAVLLASCGGGSDTSPPATQPFAEALRSQALQAPAERPAAAATAVTGDMVLDWAEYKLPELFPKAVAQKFPSVVFDGVSYNVRAYGGPWGTRYLGITTDGRVYGLGDFTGNALRGFETVAFWSTQVLADRCGVYPQDCAAAPRASGQARLALGSGHVVAVRADGRVLAWGANSAAQLGSGAPVPGTNAREVATTAVAVVAGVYESLALGSDGVVRGWGRKFAGTTIQGGDASLTGTDVATPTASAFPEGITHLVTGTGNQFALARRSDGTVWHLPGTATPVAGGSRQAARAVANLPAVAALGGGVSADPLAIGSDGSVWSIRITALGGGSWQAGATQVAGLTGTVAARCQGFGCIALDANAAVREFATPASATPRLVGGLPPIVQIASTGSRFLALDRDGRVWQWNAGATPEAVAGLDQVVEVAGGLQTALVRRADGSVWGWGSNFLGELGAAAPTSTSTPVRVQGIQLD